MLESGFFLEGPPPSVPHTPPGATEIGVPGPGRCSSGCRREQGRDSRRGISSLRDSLIPLGYLQPQHSSPRVWGEELDQLPHLPRPPYRGQAHLGVQTPATPHLGAAGGGKGVSSPRSQWGHILPAPTPPPGPSNPLPSLRFRG